MISQRSNQAKIIVVILLAAIMRMTLPGVTEFKADEARLYALAYELASGGSLPLHGIGSSIGLPNFPLSVWLYAIPIAVWQHPYSPTVFTGLLNTLAVFACWWFTRRYWGATAAIIAALLFAVSPWAIVFSRKIWAQNLLPLFSIGWAITGVLALENGKRRAALAHGLLLGCVPQIHPSGIPLTIISVVAALIYRRRIAWHWLATGTLIAVCMATPLVIHIYAEGITPLSVFSGIPISFRLDPILYTWMLSTGMDLQSLAGTSHHSLQLSAGRNISPVHWTCGLLIAIGIWSLVRTKEAKNGFPARFVIAWLMFPALLFIWSPVPVYPHYFIVTFPAQYIAAAVGVSKILKQVTNPLHRTVSWGFLMIYGVLQIYIVLTLFKFISLHATPGGYGTPLWMKLNVVDAARTALRTGPTTEVLIVGNGNNPATHHFPAVYGTLLLGIPHRYVDGTASAIMPVSPALVLLQNKHHPAAMHYFDWGKQPTSIPMRTGEDPVTLLELSPVYTESLLVNSFDPPNTLANGVTLLGYKPVLSKPGLRWELHWSTSNPTHKKYHFFNHLLDATGQRIAQADAPTFPAYQWREGDRVISYFSTPLTFPPDSLVVGMYTYPDIKNVPLLDGAQNFASHSVTSQWHSP